MFSTPAGAPTHAAPIHIFAARFDARLGHTPALMPSGTGGIVLLAAAPLVLIADLSSFGLANEGASATNAMDDIMGAFRTALPMAGDAKTQVWVELDSDGCFDLVSPGAHGCTFAALQSASGAHPARSRAAFLEMFAERGAQMLEELAQIAASERVLH